MTGRVTVVYANEQPPDAWNASVFIAGPMPRTTDVPSWRPAALKAVEAAWHESGELVVFVPEPRDGVPLRYDHHAWEDSWLAVVDVILFWVPREMQDLPGLTTNVEFGRWESSGRVVLGTPPTAVRVGYLRECAARNRIPTADSLEDAASAVIALIDGGERRTGCECQIPLLVWRSSEFRTWHLERQRLGVALKGARVLWLETASDGTPVRWIMSVQGQRFAHATQSNEFVAFGDISGAT
jgi:Nucleoside 2-deoxyribosyltransferase like